MYAQTYTIYSSTALCMLYTYCPQEIQIYIQKKSQGVQWATLSELMRRTKQRRI